MALHDDPSARPEAADTAACGDGLNRRAWLLGSAALAAGAAVTPPPSAGATAAPRVLRYAFPTSETGFDPAQISDLYSRTVTPQLFEGLYRYDQLARPPLVRPLTAEALPEVDDDFRRWTIRLRRGIHFADDPVFGGRPRELTAADYVYSFKRFYDPALNSPTYASLEAEGILGLEALRRQAIEGKRPFDYDREVEGLQLLDRYTLRIRLAESRPRFLQILAQGDLLCAVAREVVEHYGQAIAEHPVGTGPFRLAQWRRRSLIVLERNPGFRAMTYDEQPAPDDAQGQAIRRRFEGRRLPMLDRVEISIIDEAQPRWLAFLNRQHDLLQVVPPEFATLAVPNGRLAPNLQRQGVQLIRQVNADVALTVYNMDDPVIGGLAPERVALRRALNLAFDPRREIDIARRGQAVPAMTIVPPHTFGYDPALVTELGAADLARAKSLLDVYGWRDRDGDGWRETPDGRPLVLELSSPPDQIYRDMTEVRKRATDALGLRLEVRIGNWAEQLKAARAGRFMIWMVASSASLPDGLGALERAYGPASGGANLARFRLPAFDAVYEELKRMPDGPQRAARFQDANRLLLAYAPYRPTLHRVVSDLAQEWVHGYRRGVCWNDFWSWVDVDPEAQARGTA